MDQFPFLAVLVLLQCAFGRRECRVWQQTLLCHPEHTSQGLKWGERMCQRELRTSFLPLIPVICTFAGHLPKPWGNTSFLPICLGGALWGQESSMQRGMRGIFLHYWFSGMPSYIKATRLLVREKSEAISSGLFSIYL